MPWMLQPKSYTQIARPNLYNVAYRRVGTYKGMGRLHPTNYLQIGVRPNRIGATTGQYNTLSGQLSLLPPSLRGLGQSPPISTYLDASGAPVNAEDPTAVFGLDIHGNLVNLYTATTLPGGTDTAAVSTAIQAPQAAQAQQMQKWTPWIILGGGLLLFSLMVGGRR